MDEDPAASSTADSGSEPTSTTSTLAKLFDVLATPSDVFEEIRNGPPRIAHWLVPAMIAAVVGIISTAILFSQPALVQQIRETQSRQMEKQVASGQMTRAQADQAEKVMDSFGPATFKIFGGMAATVSAFVIPLWWGLMIWALGGIVFKANFPFMKAVESAGIASVMFVLAYVVGTMLGMILGRLYTTPSLGLLVKEIDPANKMHMALLSINVLYLWFACLLGVALSKLGGFAAGKAILAVLTLWISLRIIFIPLGLGQFFM